nr:MAG TPA: hypothetical protein [Crassvirales sp.]
MAETNKLKTSQYNTLLITNSKQQQCKDTLYR